VSDPTPGAPFFQLLGQVDVLRAAAKLVYQLDKDPLSPEQNTMQVLPEWHSMIRPALAAIANTSLEFVDAQVVLLWPGTTVIPPQEPDVEMVILPISTGPTVFLYSGPQVLSPYAGSVWWVTSKVPLISVNCGDYAAYILVIHARNHVPVGTPEKLN
jgi:hypothetical protein